jgi:hypothetical protein
MLYIYLYSVTGVALFVFTLSVMAGVNGFYDFAFNVPIPAYETAPTYRGPITFGLGYALISLPIWLYHWRRLTQESEKFATGLLTGHRFYLFTVVCLSMMMGIIAGGNGFTNALRLLFGFAEEAAVTLSNMATAFTLLIVAACLWLHHWRQFRGRFGDLDKLLKTEKVKEEPAI